MTYCLATVILKFYENHDKFYAAILMLNNPTRIESESDWYRASRFPMWKDNRYDEHKFQETKDKTSSSTLCICQTFHTSNSSRSVTVRKPNSQSACYKRNSQWACYKWKSQWACYKRNTQSACYKRNSQSACYKRNTQSACYKWKSQSACHKRNSQSVSYKGKLYFFRTSPLQLLSKKPKTTVDR